MITCRDILNLKLDGVELITGEKGLDRLVSWTYLVQTRPYVDHMNQGNFALIVVDYVRFDFEEVARTMEEFEGIAFSHARLGDVHAMSHPVSAYFHVAHGIANAILLPTIVKFNELSDQGKYYDIYKTIAKCPVEKNAFSSDMLEGVLKELNAELGIPCGLKEVGVKEELFEAMADDAMKSGNIAVNPRNTTKSDIIDLYKKSF